METNREQQLLEQVQRAVADKHALVIIGGNSKSFYGRKTKGKPVFVNAHNGVIDYLPSELVITARAGTPIKDINALLAEHKQMIGFEPAFCNDNSTLAGVIAAGLSGPRRPYAGAVRDFMLGIKMINGRGEMLKFGGQVMKNVAGFDHSRLMAGSLGTLGLLLEISLRVMPVPEFETTISVELPGPDQAIEFFNRLAAKPYPVSATAWYRGFGYVRLSGTEGGVRQAVNQLDGLHKADAGRFWSDLRDHKLKEFDAANVIHRISLPAARQITGLDADQIIEWGGAQRWVFNRDRRYLEQLIEPGGGHVTQFKGADPTGEVFTPLEAVMRRLHHNIKSAFDPDRVFNPGRMYQDL